MTTQYKNRDLRKLTSLWIAADDNQITLPEHIGRLREAHRHATDQARAITAPDGPGTPAELTDLVMVAAVNGGPLPDLDAVAHGFARRQAASALATAARITVDALEDRIVGATLGAADEIVEHHLAPAFDDVLQDLRRVAHLLEHRDLNPSTLLSAPVKVREARIELDVIVNRYGTMQMIYGSLGPALDITLDVTGRFSEMSNPVDIVGSNDPIGHARPPWPTDDPAARLLWLVGHGAELWMPTAEQRDAAFRAAFPDSPAVAGRHAVASTVGA